jgi:hypothetical protein
VYMLLEANFVVALSDKGPQIKRQLEILLFNVRPMLLKQTVNGRNGLVLPPGPRHFSTPADIVVMDSDRHESPLAPTLAPAPCPPLPRPPAY